MVFLSGAIKIAPRSPQDPRSGSEALLLGPEPGRKQRPAALWAPDGQMPDALDGTNVVGRVNTWKFYMVLWGIYMVLFWLVVWNIMVVNNG